MPKGLYPAQQYEYQVSLRYIKAERLIRVGTDGQTGRQTDGQADGRTGRQTGGWTGIYTEIASSAC